MGLSLMHYSLAMKYTLLLAFLLAFAPLAQAGKHRTHHKVQKELSETEIDALALKTALAHQDSVCAAMHYERGDVMLGNNVAKLKVPIGFKFLGKAQGLFIVNKVWGNLLNEDDFIGMIFPEDDDPYTAGSYVAVLSHTSDGYVKDDDAKDIDYDDLMVQMKKDALEENEERKKANLSRMDLLGWAQKPFYNANEHRLYWAKEFVTDTAKSSPTVVNYSLITLGRQSMLTMNIVCNKGDLPMVNKSVPTLLRMVEFTEGNRYSDFNVDIDKVAAYGIGGLVAGKVLAKIGAFALVLKFWKVIIGGLVAAFAALRKRFMGNQSQKL